MSDYSPVEIAAAARRAADHLIAHPEQWCKGALGRRRLTDPGAEFVIYSHVTLVADATHCCALGRFCAELGMRSFHPGDAMRLIDRHHISSVNDRDGHEAAARELRAFANRICP